MRTLSLIAAALLLASCSDNDANPTTLAGTYNASAFTVTPSGQAAINVLSAGGSLTMTITSDGVVSGSMSLPASVTGGAPLVADMIGVATQSGTTVTFDQTADTFVRDLNWKLSAEGLSVTSQSAGSASYTITLARMNSCLMSTATLVPGC